MGDDLPLRKKLLLLMDEIEEEHTYSLLRGACSCGFKSRDMNVVKFHYVDEVVSLFDRYGLKLS